LQRDLWQPNEVWSGFMAAMLAKHRGKTPGGA
jgi:hypothetical protein